MSQTASALCITATNPPRTPRPSAPSSDQRRERRRQGEFRMSVDTVRSIGGKPATFLTNESRETSDGWYRGSVVNFFPRGREATAEREVEEIYKHVLKGWVPDQPFITKTDLITAFGSCFAAHLEQHLRGHGYRTSI